MVPFITSHIPTFPYEMFAPQPQPTEPQPNVFIVFISLNKYTKRPYMVYTDKMCFH